jgi:acyl-ACP thioesterase
MADRGYSWVLIRTELWMEEYPKYDEFFDVYTATSETRHGVYPRYYEIRKDGRVIGKAMALWVVLDNVKRCMVSEKETGISVVAAKKRTEIPKFPVSPKPLEEGDISLSKRTVRYTDLDMVGHMNNTHYIDWLTDAIPWQTFKEKQIEHLIIGYSEETRPDTELILELKTNGDRFSFRDLSENTEHFVLCGEWRDLQGA